MLIFSLTQRFRWSNLYVGQTTTEENGMSLVQLIYGSEPLGAITQEDVMNIVDESQTWNSKNGITGVLYYNRRNFLQCLEGDRIAVSETYQKILTDKRHHRCRLFLCQDVVKRDFVDWDMEYIGEGKHHRNIFYLHSKGTELQLDEMSGETTLLLLKALRDASL